MNRGLPPWLIDFVCQYVKNHGLTAHDILFYPGYVVYNVDSWFDAVLKNSTVDPIHRARVFAVTKWNGDVDEVRKVLES